MTTRTHVAKGAPVERIRARRQAPGATYKPVGLWYEVDGDWRRWAGENMHEWVEGHPVQVLHLGAERMLTLSTAEDLDRLTAQFGDDPDYVQAFIDGKVEAHAAPRGFGLNSRLSFAGIRWDRLAQEYDGVEIAPYVWSRRLSLIWYYGWDCASGCIWRPRGAHLDPPEAVAGVHQNVQEEA